MIGLLGGIAIDIIVLVYMISSNINTVMTSAVKYSCKKFVHVTCIYVGYLMSGHIILVLSSQVS